MSLHDHHVDMLDASPQLIGRGSFASVYVILASLVAFKEVQLEADAPQLQAECDTLAQIYESCHSNSFFSLPRPLAYNDPRDSHSFRRLVQSPSCPVKTGLTRRLRPLRVVALGSFAAFERPAFAMERIYALPTEVSARIREQFYPADAPDKGPSLLRLFFGSDFANSDVTGTFLDVTRYRQLASSEEGIADDLPDAEIVAEAMGHILGRIQVLGRYDGRGIKFVLGGNGYSGFEFYVIDFHQARRWDCTVETISQLVDAYRSIKMYLPFPRRGDREYEAFKYGYRAAYSDHPGIADEFLDGIEVLQPVSSPSGH
ncbi:uncharacterized protein ARMOST_18020 [Armillaria ostoyae]|uniref:DUF3669 domain-containing protein n=1 Tax=Armillaria ostoyae TaxID=47428 RepID=A0A284S0P4_ARMOS|nr:uncharacterized protein ARMOST_18020 [Armillaria ostoyae]